MSVEKNKLNSWPSMTLVLYCIFLSSVMKNRICWNHVTVSSVKTIFILWKLEIQICFDFFTCKSSLEYSVSMSKLIICTYMKQTVLPTQRRKKLPFLSIQNLPNICHKFPKNLFYAFYNFFSYNNGLGFVVDPASF